jgi:cytochrome c-type biogenesis protein CcmE
VNKRSRTRLLIATGIIIAVFAAGVVYVVQRQSAYYGQVSELTTEDYDGKNVKVGGRVLDDTISRDESGVHFEIVDLTGTLDVVAVTYAGQMPNAFAEGADVVVTGRYAAADGLIAAEQLQTKCPSKYEGKASPAAQPGQ